MARSWVLTKWGALGTLGFGLSRGFERIGDLSFSAGDSGTALVCHLLALVLLIVTIVCGWKFMRALWRRHGVFGLKEESDVEQDAQVFADAPQSTPQFDPDSALANYLDEKLRQGKPVPPSRSPSEFGRKSV